MATKWADHVITAVRFNAAGTHIDSVRVHEHEDGERLGTASTHSRTEIVLGIELGSTYCTSTKGSDAKWYYGAAVKIVVVDGVKYIRTKADRTKADNLDKLPTF